MFKRFGQSLVQNNRGDTIVEVLVAIAIIGAVLGSAYVATNNNTRTNRQSQERLQATKIAESQLERLKAMSGNAASQDAIFQPGTFCLTTSNVRVSSSNAACQVNSAGVATGSQPYYNITITPGASISGTGPVSYPGTQFRIDVTWDTIGGGDSIVTYEYGVYR